MKTALMPNLTRRSAAEVTEKICGTLDRLGIEYYGTSELASVLPDGAAGHVLPAEELFNDADVIISVGGDGSVIRAVRQACVTRNRVLGVNAGNLAYLCELDPDELELLGKLKTGDYTIQKRMMLTATVTSGGRIIYEETGVNDVVFRTDADAKLIGLDVDADGKRIADYYADGVIFATPTGSSAYSLSAGGAIVEPTVDATLVTPICPHSLIIRPYVFRADTVFTVRPDAGNRHTVLSVDGLEGVRLPEDCTVTVKKAETSAEFISLKSNLFIEVLNKKLG